MHIQPLEKGIKEFWNGATESAQLTQNYLTQTIKQLLDQEPSIKNAYVAGLTFATATSGESVYGINTPEFIDKYSSLFGKKVESFVQTSFEKDTSPIAWHLTNNFIANQNDPEEYTSMEFIPGSKEEFFGINAINFKYTAGLVEDTLTLVVSEARIPHEQGEISWYHACAPYELERREGKNLQFPTGAHILRTNTDKDPGEYVVASSSGKYGDDYKLPMRLAFERLLEIPIGIRDY